MPAEGPGLDFENDLGRLPGVEADTVALRLDLAAVPLPTVPVVHRVGGDVAAMVGENLPAAQLVHTPPPAANLPAAQLVQSLSASDPAGEDLPAAQLVQTPPAAANLPAA